MTYTYNYDANGNITSVSDGTYTTSYAYDTANQLIRENNQEAGKTWTYEYDNAGNILSKSEYVYTEDVLGTPTDTITYAYTDSNWGDLLTGYDGQAFTYDGIGNLLTDGTWTYTWRNGRELASMTDGTQSWQFTYNADGMRTKKTNGTDTYSYIYNGGSLSQLVISTATTVDETTTTATQTLNFAYDTSGTPMALTYNGTTYYYATNLQGDVVAILDTTGTAVVTYTYDAWGEPLTTTGSLASTLGTLNPLRYRGYVYDPETGLYYVSSRYYDPEIGRFINADDVDLLGANGDFASLNLFAYCGNNPVSRADSNGYFWNIVIGAVVGGIVSGVVSAVTSYVQTGSIDWGSVAINAVVGAVGGAIAATGLGPLAQAGLTAVVSGAGNYVEQVYTKGFDGVNSADVICCALVGGGTSLLGSAAGKLIGGKLEKAGTALLSKGKDKLLTGMVRESMGQSHSSLLKQGAKYVTQATKTINTYRGISSSVGSLIGGVTGSSYNAIKIGVLGW